MTQFSFDISPLTLMLTIVCATCALLLIIFYRQKIMRIVRHYHRCHEPEEDTESALPGISVIVYCAGQARALTGLLDQLLGQQYRGEFEVTIVNDGSQEDIKDVYNLIAPRHSNCNLTFIPDDAHNLSHRKLAITLGVKSARHDYVCILDATTRLEGPNWLSAMGRWFAQGKDVVLGHARYDTDEDRGVGARRRSFDAACDAVTYLSAALSGHPYRGHAANMGFAKSLFFATKGFARSLNLHAGEDDIFVSQIATSDNCAVELSDDAQVTVDSTNASSHHRRWKRSHIFTGRKLWHTSRRMISLYSFTAWVCTVCAIAAMAVSLPVNYIPTIVCATACIGMWVCVCQSWHKCVIALTGRSMWISIPWMVLTQPFYNIWYRLGAWRRRSRNYTWSKAR